MSKALEPNLRRGILTEERSVPNIALQYLIGPVPGLLFNGVVGGTGGRGRGGQTGAETVAREGGRVIAGLLGQLLNDHRHGVIGEPVRLELSPTVDGAEDRPRSDGVTTFFKGFSPLSIHPRFSVSQ